MAKKFHVLFFVLLLCSEFYYIQVGEGIARPYHFMAVLVVFFLSQSIPMLFKSSVLFPLLLFVFIQLIAAAFSDRPSAAFASLTSMLANFGVAMATALILIRGKVSLVMLRKIILTVTTVSILWGLIQIIAFRSGGATLALSEQQIAQIQEGFGPGFRTEANTFGKFMILPFLLFLPDYIKNRKTASMNGIYLLFLIGILMNFTRTSIYGISVAFVFIVFRYIRQKKISKFVIRTTLIVVIIGVGLIAILNSGAGVSEYAKHKILNLFSQEEILEGGSSGYRLDSMHAALNATLSSTKRIVIGNGWGQSHSEVRTVEVQAGGGDCLDVFNFSGVVGVLAYLVYTLAIFFSAKRASHSVQDFCKAQFAEGLMFAIVGMFCTAQIAGIIITPEYWLVVGICIYLGVKPKLKRSVLGATKGRGMQ